MCGPASKANDVIWTPYGWLNKFCSFYMAAIVGIVSRYGLAIEVRHRNQPNKSKLGFYIISCFHANSHLKQLCISNKTGCFSYKTGWHDVYQGI